MRYFECIDATHSKFWSVEVDGTDVVTVFGRLGTDGQSSIKPFSSAKEANKAADKLVASKLKKGYVEVL